MGTYYALGIVKRLKAKSNQPLTKDDWKKYLNDRLDIEQYTTNYQDNVVEGELNTGVFEKNIEDFYKKLVKITGNEWVSLYYQDSGTDIEQYQNWTSGMKLVQQGCNITLSVDLAILFIEGKVFVEEFSIEPKLINWLFRHSDFSNPLTGCVMSDIVG